LQAILVTEFRVTGEDAFFSQLIPRHTLFGEEEKTMVSLSPNGKLFSCEVPTNGIMQLIVAPIDHPEMATAVFTPHPERVLLEYCWAYSGQRIVYLSKSNGITEVFVADLSTGLTRQLSLTNFTSIHVQKVSPRHPETILFACQSAKETNCCLVNILTGKSRPAFKVEGFDHFYADGDFRPRVAVRTQSEESAEWCKQNKNGLWERFLTANNTHEERTIPVTVDNTGETFYFLDNRGRNTEVLSVLRSLKFKDKRAITLEE
jgi:hypothetical protein